MKWLLKVFVFYINVIKYRKCVKLLFRFLSSNISSYRIPRIHKIINRPQIHTNTSMKWRKCISLYIKYISYLILFHEFSMKRGVKSFQSVRKLKKYFNKYLFLSWICGYYELKKFQKLCFFIFLMSSKQFHIVLIEHEISTIRFFF